MGLIDWGQCKRLDVDERARVAQLIVSVADGASDDVIASNFRAMGIKTKNDSTEFLAEFARLMFGSFRPEVNLKKGDLLYVLFQNSFFLMFLDLNAFHHFLRRSI